MSEYRVPFTYSGTILVENANHPVHAINKIKKHLSVRSDNYEVCFEHTNLTFGEVEDLYSPRNRAIEMLNDLENTYDDVLEIIKEHLETTDQLMQ